jgi:hypothetical protein
MIEMAETSSLPFEQRAQTEYVLLWVPRVKDLLWGWVFEDPEDGAIVPWPRFPSARTGEKFTPRGRSADPDRAMFQVPQDDCAIAVRRYQPPIVWREVRNEA